MAISKADIKKLADLARVEIKEAEQEKLASEMDAILEYVGQIKAVTEQAALTSPESGASQTEVFNVMRDDANPTPAESFSKALIAEFPASENNYLKVKKIL